MLSFIRPGMLIQMSDSAHTLQSSHLSKKKRKKKIPRTHKTQGSGYWMAGNTNIFIIIKLQVLCPIIFLMFFGINPGAVPSHCSHRHINHCSRHTLSKIFNEEEEDKDYADKTIQAQTQIDRRRYVAFLSQEDSRSYV